MSAFLQYSPPSSLIDIDNVESGPVRSDMCGGRSLGLSSCDLGVLLVSSQLGRFIQHIKIHLLISAFFKILDVKFTILSIIVR